MKFLVGLSSFIFLPPVLVSAFVTLTPHQAARSISTRVWQNQWQDPSSWPARPEGWHGEEDPYLDSIHNFENLVAQTEAEKRAVYEDIHNSLQLMLQGNAENYNSEPAYYQEAQYGQEYGQAEYDGQAHPEDNTGDPSSQDGYPEAADNSMYNPAEPHDNSAPPAAEPEEDDILVMGMPEIVECDVAIVGGGPAGCTCALYTARANLKTVILDKNPTLGALAITSHIANYPGVDKSMEGQELLDRIRIQAMEYGADYRRAQVFMIDTVDDDELECENEDDRRHTVYTPDAIFKTRALVLATGAMGRVAPPFPGEDQFLGQGVSYCATCDGAFFRDEEIAVKGMNLEAMEEATFLTRFAKKVHWVTPSRPRPDQDQHVRDLLDQGNVQKWQLTRLLSVEGDAVNGVTGIKVKQKHSDEPEIIPVTGVFIYAGGGGGSKPITDYVSSNIAFKEDGGVIVNEDMETNVRGVFAIGDIRNTSHKQVVVAAADGCIAAMSIDKFLNSRKSVKVDWVHR